ncbi:MAG: hypothetical protein KJ804_16750 [Proteobacteria bacterium]|nr:hypothetical protein [Pseudomonadota bacterium]MBU1059958.1 hypothetical protein [Pseudomonadota bacterium]
MPENTPTTASRLILATGSLMCLWVAAALTGALYHTNWSISTLASQYMTAVGMIKPLHTLVDYYTHIKGIEYLICVAFFVAFPVFFKYINKAPKTVKAIK